MSRNLQARLSRTSCSLHERPQSRHLNRLLCATRQRRADITGPTIRDKGAAATTKARIDHVYLTTWLSAVHDVTVCAVVRRFVDEESPRYRQHRPRDRRWSCRQASGIADAPFMESAVHVRASFDKVGRLASDNDPVIALSGIRMRQRPCDRRFVHRLARESRKIDNRRGRSSRSSCSPVRASSAAAPAASLLTCGPRETSSVVSSFVYSSKDSSDSSSTVRSMLSAPRSTSAG